MLPESSARLQLCPFLLPTPTAVAKGRALFLEATVKSFAFYSCKCNEVPFLSDVLRVPCKITIEPCAALRFLQERIPIGTAEVKAVFPAGSGKAAGCIVTEGKLVKGCQIAVVRKKKEVFFGKLDSLRRVKELAKQVWFPDFICFYRGRVR